MNIGMVIGTLLTGAIIFAGGCLVGAAIVITGEKRTKDDISK